MKIKMLGVLTYLMYANEQSQKYLYMVHTYILVYQKLFLKHLKAIV